MQYFFERLRGEREVLGFTQDVMAEKVGVSKRSYCAYEAGETAPSAKLLTALANMGVDIAYLLTGERSRPVPSTYDQPPEERALLSDYRTTDAQGKALIRAAASTAARAAHANPTATAARSPRIRRRAA